MIDYKQETYQDWQYRHPRSWQWRHLSSPCQ